jgi:hypothetical protein
MYSSGAIQVVKQFLFVCGVASMVSLFGGCGNNSSDKTPEQSSAQSGSQNIHPADTAQATEVAATERKVKELHYSAKPNEHFSYKLTQVDNLDQDGNKATMSTTYFYTKTIKEAKPDGTIDMSVRMDSIRIKSIYPNPAMPTTPIETNYNSQDSAQRSVPQFRQFTGIVGEDVRMLVSSKGKIEEISGLTPILNKILGKQKDSIPARDKDQLLEQLKYQLYQVPLQNEYQTFPDNGTVDSSQSWSRADISALSGVFKVKNSVQYSIASVKNIRNKKAALIKATLKAEVVNPNVAQGTVKFKLNESAISGEGESLIDLTSGATIFKKNRINTMINATMTESKSKQTQTAKQLLTTTITVELLK